jgi:Tfp pilus assembly protein PilX
MLARLRRDDRGQALILVMFISVLAILMLSTATTALVNQIKPAGATVDSGKATAAAQAGVENFISWVNTNCPPTDGFLCANLFTGITSKAGITDPTNQVGTVITGADGTGSSESFYWKVTYAASGFARVQSIGQVPTGKATPKYRTTTLVADINATPSFNNFQYYTKYETYSADFLNNFYKARTVQVTSAASLTGTSISSAAKPGSLQWAGTCTYVDSTTTPLCDPSKSTNICDDLYYPNPNGPGRGTDSAWNNSTRRPSTSTQTQLGTDSSFAYYAETGTYTPASGSATSVVHNDSCDSSMEPNMVMNGPIYSQDAYLVDRAKDTGSSKNSMPNFSDPAYSLWTGTINGTQKPVGANGGYDRAYPGTDGAASLATGYPSGSVFPIYQNTVLDLPANASDALPESACVYTGPTRIKVVQNTAYITSPLTPAGTSACYQSTGSFSNANTVDSLGQSTTDSSGGVINAQVPVDKTIIYVKNPDASVTPTAATYASPVFKATTNLAVPAPANTKTLAATFTNPTLYTATSSCPTTWPASLTKQGDFDCETGKTSQLDDTVTKVNTNLAALPATTAQTPATIATAITSAMNAGNSGTALPSSIASKKSFYLVTVGTPTAPTTTTTPATHDGFYDGTDGNGYTTTTTTWPVTITRNYCSDTSTCTGSGSSKYDSPQTMLSGSFKQVSSAANSTLNSSENFPWFGKQPGDTGYDAAKTYTDADNDVTQYYHGYGDAYVEGTVKGSLSIIAEHDIEITNDVTYSNTTLTGTSATTDGLALVANHNVRIYRPMTCAHDGTLGATTAGFCPDDTSGVYTDNLSWPVNSNYPSNMYVPNNAPSITHGGTGTIYATIFTLRGSFMADNFYRGSIGYGINIYGGLYQYHRGATSLPYQGRPYQGSTTKMPGIAVTYNYDNMRAGNTDNGGLRVPYIPTPSGRLTSNTWNVISISTGS